MKRLREYFLERMAEERVVSTHSHYFPEAWQPRTLYAFLSTGYVSWMPLEGKEDTKAGRRLILEQMAAKSYYVWAAKALQEVLKQKQPLSEKTWAQYDEAYRSYYSWENSLRVLKQQCRYERVLLDPFWKPGTSHDEAIFTPVFRINSFIVAPNRVLTDHSKVNPFKAFGLKATTFKDYIDECQALVRRKKAAGAVALKAAVPYDRGIDFAAPNVKAAAKVFGAKRVTAKELKLYGDTVFDQFCRIAAEEGLPLQIHTGLGLLQNSNPMALRDTIVRHPKTKFVLFHGGFPYMDEVCGLVHQYVNVYPDLCWLPQISPTAATTFIKMILEIGLLDRLTWGCDTFSGIDTYGALLALRHSLATALADMVDSGYLSRKTAEDVILAVLRLNAKKLYGV